MSNTQQPEALRLARKFEEVGFMGDHRFAQDHWCRQAAAELRRQHARIEELEAELAALKAAPAKVTVEQVVELEVDDLIDRLLNAQQDLNLAANVHMDQSIASASTLLDEVEIALRTLAATHPTQQGLDAQTIKHISALSELVRMPNAEHFADAHNAAVRHLRVIAAQAKQGEQANG